MLVEHLAGPADVHSWIPGPKERSVWDSRKIDSYRQLYTKA